LTLKISLEAIESMCHPKLQMESILQSEDDQGDSGRVSE
jgi:hypothetical protein